MKEDEETGMGRQENAWSKLLEVLGGNGANIKGKGLSKDRRVSEHEGWGKAVEQGDEESWLDILLFSKLELAQSRMLKVPEV